MDFILCPQCNGEGSFDHKVCKTCSGRGVYSWFGGYVLLSDKLLGRNEIITFKIKRFFRAIINILLVLFGLGGLLCLLKIIIDLPNLSLDFLKNYFVWLNLDQKSLVLFFWLSVLFDSYLFYFIEHNRESQQKSWPKSSRESANQPDTWAEIHRLPKRFKIDVASAFSRQAIRLMQKAWNLSKRLKHQKIESIHILAAGLEINDIVLVIGRLGLNRKVLQSKVARALVDLPVAKDGGEIVYSLETKKALLQAYNLAGVKNRLALSPLEILESVVSFEGPVKEIFYDLEIEPVQVKNVCLWIDVYNQLRQEQYRFAGQARFKPKGPINRAYTATATPYLDAYSQDLTQLARGGYFGFCINREKEIQEILRIAEGGRQSVILVGEPGVGKKTIIQGLARRMVAEDVPKFLQDKRFVGLDLPSLIAGASRPGEIEERLQIIINEIVRSGNIILFVKDIHNMSGVKTTEGELDVSKILADALEGKLFLTLATSNPSEYRRLIDGQILGEVCQRVNIEEPDKNATIQILQAHTALIEGREKVYFSYSALDRVVDLSIRYLHERFLPEKAISLLKEVAIAVKSERGERTVVQAEDVAKLVAEKTKIPVTKITEKESEKLLNLEEQIHQRLVDQNEAVDMVAAALRRGRTELRSAKRPIVNLLFLGPTGVGKTELAKTVAEVYFGREDRMIRLDMSEYQEKASINRLIGTPGGEKGGQLTEAVRLNPSSLLLLDEIEKANPDILNVFLQVMDDGRLTDALGRTIDFTNIILIGTSNAGTQFIQEEITKGTSIEVITEVLIREKLKPYFRPEFLNRFDGVIVFKPLGKEEIRQITKLLLNKLVKQLEQKGIILKLTEEAIIEIAEAGFDPLFGARPLNRAIQNRVSDVLAKFLLTGKLERRDVVVLEKGGQIRVEKARKI